MTRETSIAAYRHLQRSGKFSSNKDRAVWTLAYLGPMTAKECTEALRNLGVKIPIGNNVQPVLHAAVKEGLVVDGLTRTCTVTGRRVMYYTAVVQLAESGE